MKLISLKIFLLAIMAFILSACGGPIKNSEVQEKITEEIPSFLKIKEFKLGETSEEQNSMDGWFVEAPFELKLEFADNTYDPLYKRFDYTDKTKTILFLKDNRKKGEVMDFAGVARMNYEKINSGKIVQKLSVEIKKFLPTSYGKTIPEYEKEYFKAYPASGKDAKKWLEGYADLIKKARALLPGEWDNGIYYSESGLCILMPNGDKIPIERKWTIDSNGVLKTFESGAVMHTNNLLVSVSGDEITFQDMDISKENIKLENLLYREAVLRPQKKVKDISKLKADAQTYAKNLQGIWDSNWYNKGSIGIIKDDGTLVFSEKDPKGGLSGNYEKGTWKFVDNYLYIDITETERGKSEWKRYFKVVTADGKTFQIQQVRDSSSDRAPKYEGKLVRSIGEQAEYEKTRAEVLRKKLLGKWQWYVSQGTVNAPKLAGTRYPHKTPPLDVFSTFEENGSFTHSFFFKPGRNGPYYEANSYKGSWKINGEMLIISLTEKDGKGIPVETYKYNISERAGDQGENLYLTCAGLPKGIMSGYLYRSDIGAEGPLAPQSKSAGAGSSAQASAQSVSAEESSALSQVQSLVEATNAAIKLNSQVVSEKNASLAAQKASEMKKKTIPELEKKLSDTKKYLVQNSGKIGQKTFSAMSKSVRECESCISTIKQNLAKYSTLEEGIDNIKNLGNKILDLF